VAEKGLSFLLKLAGTAIGGMRTTAMAINGSEVDITNKDSTSQWRELLPAAGEVSMTISASGVFLDNGNLTTVRGYVIAMSINTFVLEFESGDTYTGSFQVTNCEQAGEYNGEVTYSITLESSGVITFAAA
jgi:TP901-1 family phage major tail protein